MSTHFQVIKDPVHGTMQFTAAEDAWVKPFIDSPHFQRLRHIKQMGMGDFIFPGAVHTRFNHSLGCCYVASQIAHKIGLVEEERQLVMIACLLHDIGHGPFSHTFEDVFHDKLIRHEDWTPYFLSDYGHHEFFSHYNRMNPRYHMTEEKFQTIANMIMHHGSQSVLGDIVSSQLDADRLDYLLRDSHFCGVRYGEFDFRWMLHCLAIVNCGDNERLGITYKGIGTVEHYLMARRLMTRNIYQSQKKLALEALLIQLLSHIAVSLGEEPRFKALSETRLGQLLIAANQFNLIVKSSNHVELHKKAFIESNYANYKELCDYDVFALIKQLADMNDHHPCSQLAIRLQHRRLPHTRRIESNDLPKVEIALQEFKESNRHRYQDWQILLVRNPHQSYSDEEDPIYVISEQNEIKPISDFSVTINAISNRLEHVAFITIDDAIAENTDIKQFLNHMQRTSELVV